MALTKQELLIGLSSLEETLYGKGNKLVENGIKKFMPLVDEKVIDHDVVNYVKKSKLIQDPYQRAAAVNKILNSLKGDENYFWDMVFEEKSYSNFRELAYDLFD